MVSMMTEIEPRCWQVLGVERDPELILRERALLEELGFGVVTATTLSGALAACRALRFDLMIIGSSVQRSTAEALLRFAGQCGGPPFPMPVRR